MGWQEASEFWFRFGVPIVETAVLYVLLYWLLRSLERISASVKLKGMAFAVVLIAVGAMVAQILQLHALNWLLKNAVTFTALILAIVFQPEVRRLFTRLGGWLPSSGQTDNVAIMDQLIDAIDFMAQRRVGALIVLERNDHLDNYIASSPLDCDLTTKSLVTVFWKDSPLHDGAVIIRNGRISAAGVILPLTENFEFKDLNGTRHRAGIGISEDTDAVAVLVSEETGTISAAFDGKFEKNLTREDLEILLARIFDVRNRRGEDL